MGKVKTGDTLRLYLAQETYPAHVHGEALLEGPISEPSPEHLEEMKAILSRIPQHADLVVLSGYPGAFQLLPEANKTTVQRGQVTILPLGRIKGPDESETSTVAVLGVTSEPCLLHKISLSVEDQEKKLRRGDQLCVFETPLARFAVLNCHDYTHADLLVRLAEAQVEILIVTTFNPASQLYAQYALADAHRLFCFVIVVNIGNLGGSGVFGPFRRRGSREQGKWVYSLGLGGRLFHAEGAGVARVELELPLGELRKWRQAFAEPGPMDAKKGEVFDYDPIIAAESFLPMEEARYKSARHNIREVELAAEGYQPMGDRKARIGIAQLRCMDDNDYLLHSYHISRSPNATSFKNRIRSWLARLGKQLDPRGLDFLIFPEVFLPLGLCEDVAVFAKRFNTIVIAGMEYDPQLESSLYGTELARGKNRCFIWVPTTDGGVRRYEYTKLTRSQYDARTLKKGAQEKGSFPKDKGDYLLRFRHPAQGSFGVLICYDLSHFEVMWSLNREHLAVPLDMVFVLANNPDGKLYRTCCLADSHRFYQYLVLCNVAQFGRSGIFGPLRSAGERQVLLDAGIGSETIAIADVDLAGLQEARTTADRRIEDKGKFRKKPGIFQEHLEWDCVVCSVKGGKLEPRPLSPG
jgi:predicted amidohydrolase